MWIFVCIMGIFPVYIWSAIGLVAATLFLLDFTRKSGDTIPIPELMVLLAALQWVVGPYIDFHNEFEHYKYKMYVSEEQYMAFAVPVVLAFKAGLTFFHHDVKLTHLKESINNLLVNHPKFPYILVAIGIIAPFSSQLFPPGLAFVFFLLGQVKYIGALYFILSGHPNRWFVFSGLMILSALSSMASGMFHDLLLWLVLTMSFVFHELKSGFWSKLTILIIGAFFIITIQSVKQQYREISPSIPGNIAKTGLFIGLASNEWRSGKITNPSSDNEMNVRLNQGWIISKVMDHVPNYEPYAYGQTILDAIEAAFLPRIIAPNKKTAGGKENFKKYTGLPLGDNTSMGISLAGEGWANFGSKGGIVFLFAWGLFVGWFWKKLNRWSNFLPTLLVWSPILFLQTVKAETELVVVLNHLIKSSIIVFGLLYYFYKYKGIRV
jgi:hypothetical protein